MLIFNFEMVFPFIKECRYERCSFYDAGNTWNDRYYIDDLRQSVGFGIRWYSPIGPLRLEYGHIVNRKGLNDDSAGRLGIYHRHVYVNKERKKRNLNFLFTNKLERRFYMKRNIYLMAGFILLVFVWSTNSLAADKIGFINLQEIMQNSNAGKKAGEDLKKLYEKETSKSNQRKKSLRK